MPTVTFYADSQRANSTHIPSSTVISGDCLLKHPTDLYNPTIVFNGDCHTATQFSLMGKYYWITKMVSVRNGVWEVTGKENVLATFKTAIGNGIGYIAYADTKDNFTIPDDRLGVKACSSLVNYKTKELRFLDTGNIYVSVGITCIDHIEVNLMGLDELRRLLSPYSGKTPAQIQKALGAGEVTCLNSITGAFWLPIDYDELGEIFDPDGPGGYIKFGTDITTTITRRTTHHIICQSGEVAFDIPTINDWTVVNATLEIRMPLYGVISIPAINVCSSALDGSLTMDSQLYANYHFNLYSGDYVIEVYRKTGLNEVKTMLATVSGNCAVSIPVGANIDNAAVNMIGAMGSLVGNTLSGNWGEAVGNAAEGYGILTHCINTSQPVVINSGTGGVPIVADTIIAVLTRHDLNVIDPNMQPLKQSMGVPVKRQDKISTIVASGTGSGYVQGTNLNVSGVFTATEREEIESLFRNGFYYE